MGTVLLLCVSKSDDMSIRDAAGYLSALMTCVKEDSKFVLVCADGRVWCVLMGGCGVC